MRRPLVVFFVVALILGPVIPLSLDDTSKKPAECSFSPEPQTALKLASNGKPNASIIKVVEDAPVIDGSPDSNWDDDSTFGGLWVGNDSIGNMARSWLKFSLSHIPCDAAFANAKLNLFLQSRIGTEDYPIGVYCSENDTWSEKDLTWNNQPNYAETPIDIIDSPESPGMFVEGNWYQWDVTSLVVQTIEGEGNLTLVLQQVNEDLSNVTGGGFASREYSVDNGVCRIPHISLNYSVPTTTNLTVNGFSEAPQIDYIQDPTPQFGWTFNDEDTDDHQTNYELEVWNDSSYSDTRMMAKRNNDIKVIYDSAGSGNSRPFGTDDEMRFQFKWPASMIANSGIVDKLYFKTVQSSAALTYYDLQIYMLGVSDSADLTSDFEGNYDQQVPVQVLNRSSYSTQIQQGFLVFDIENTFFVKSHMNLLIEVRYSGYDGPICQVIQTVGGSGSVAYEYGTDSYCANTAGYVLSRTHDLRMEYVTNDVYKEGYLQNYYPFGLPGGIPGRFQIKYNRSMIDQSGVIDRILFPVIGSGNVTYENFSVYLVETPVEGALNHTHMSTNYGGVEPTKVLDAEEYVIRNRKETLIIDVEDIFFYKNSSDLLIELRFDDLKSGDENVFSKVDGGAYRAWTWEGGGNDTYTYDMLLDFTYDASEIIYSGAELQNATRYYWRVRTCDSFGIWSPWETGSFKFEQLESEPQWSGLTESSDPVEFGSPVTISITVTHITGIKQVLISYAGSNHTMSKSGDVYTCNWNPLITGSLSYVIYMEAYSGAWSQTSGNIDVIDTTPPAWDGPPQNQELAFDEALVYKLNATDLSDIAGWQVNDTNNFLINDFGLLRNKTMLQPGMYGLNITVTDTEGNSISAQITITVLEPTTTTTTTTSTSTTSTTETTTETTETTSTTSTTPPPNLGDNTLLLVAGAVIAAVIVVFIIVYMKRKS